MTPEDLQEMRRRLEQETLLHAHGFEPVLLGEREPWTRDDKLYTRSRALVTALHKVTEPIERG